MLTNKSPNANEKNKQQTNRIIFYFIYLLQKLVERLNTMKLVVSNKTALKKLDSYGVNFDALLKEMQAMEVKAISNPDIAKQSDATFKIVLDNIDLRIATRDMTYDQQNRDIHWVNHSAVKNHVTRGNREQVELSQLDNCKLLPTAADHEKLRKDFTHLVSRILVENLPCMQFLQSVAVKHIPHQYSKEMAKKFEKVNKEYHLEPFGCVTM